MGILGTRLIKFSGNNVDAAVVSKIFRFFMMDLSLRSIKTLEWYGIFENKKETFDFILCHLMMFDLLKSNPSNASYRLCFVRPNPISKYSFLANSPLCFKNQIGPRNKGKNNTLVLLPFNAVFR